MKKILIVFGLLVFFAVTASATTGYVDPNGDLPPLFWTPLPDQEGAHYITIDDGVRQPTTPDTDNMIAAPETGQAEVFTMSSIDLGGGTATEITIWLYSDDGTYVSIYANGEWKTPQLIVSVPADWDYTTFTGTFTQTDINNLQVKITSDGVPTVFAMYAEITYTEEVPEFFGIHFEWFDLSNGLIAAILAIALPMTLYKRKKR